VTELKSHANHFFFWFNQHSYGMALKTIKVHRGHVMEKLGVQSSGQLLAMVLRVVLTKE
jgi:hypothetical protein